MDDRTPSNGYGSYYNLSENKHLLVNKINVSLGCGSIPYFTCRPTVFTFKI